ncbi:MAG: hypothetical protein ABJC12_03565 [Saprospiraceae bacterium]
MSFPIRISNITFGGNGADNPVPLTRDNYYLSVSEQSLLFMSSNAIVPNQTSGTYAVTVLVILDPVTKQPRLGPNDLCFPPCPPFCQ